MNSWRDWEIGDNIKYSWNEFDGRGSIIGVLIQKEEDYSIVKADDMNLWLDDDTCHMFKKI